MRFKRLICALAGIAASLLVASVSLAHDSGERHADKQARVGNLAYFEGSFGNSLKGPLEIQFHAVKLEDGVKILSLKSLSADGSYRFGVQFFDGANHEVTIQAINPDNGELLAEEKTVVEVEALHPPASAKIKTIAFLLALIGLGMAAGVAISRIGKKKELMKGGNSYAT